jgi:hypothetical protein
MRLPTLFAISSLFFGFATAIPQSGQDVTCFSEINCSGFDLAATAVPTTTLSEPELTNAQRLTLGLPPKPPRRRFTPTRALRGIPSVVPPVNVRGMIRVDRADGSGTLGYVSAHPFSGAQYRYQDISNALLVEFSLTGTTETGIDLLTEVSFSNVLSRGRQLST